MRLTGIQASTQDMQKRLRKKIARKIIKARGSLSEFEYEKLRKVQKNIITKDQVTVKSMEDAEDLVENCEDMLSYVLSITSPFKK